MSADAGTSALLAKGDHRKWNFMNYIPLRDHEKRDSEKAAATAQETERPQATGIRVRRQDPERPVSALRAARCLFTEDFPREVSRTITIRIS